MVTQTIQFETISVAEVGSGTITAFLYDEDTLVATLASIEENSTLKGRYTGTVDDIPAETHRLVVKFNDITVNDADERVNLLLEVGTYVTYRTVATLANQTAILAAISDLEAGSVLGPGSDSVSLYIKDDGVGVENVSVWITSDSGGATVVAGTLSTDADGKVTFLLTAGITYYLWAQKAGKVSIQGRSFVAVAD